MTALTKKIKVTALLLVTVSTAGMAYAGNSASYPSYSPDLLPPSPTPGLCYARVEIPAQYTSTTERVMIEEGYTTTQAQQGQLVPSQERVMTKEPSIRFDVRQPSFRTVPQKVMVRPSYEKLFISKPKFDTVTETLNSAPPVLVWKRGNPGKLIAQGYKIHSTADGGAAGGGYSSVSDYTQSSNSASHCGDTCEIWCLVEEPSEAVTFNRRVMKAPGNIRRQSVPAKYQTVMKQVVADPGGVREIPVPAEYTMINVEKIANPGGVREVNVPPKFGQVAKKKLVSPARYEWRQVVCKPGTGTIRSSESYSQAVTPAIVTPLPSAPSYVSSSSTYTAPTYSAPVQASSSSYYDKKTGYYGDDVTCSGHSCASAGDHGMFEGRSRTYGGPVGSSHSTTQYSGSSHSSVTHSGTSYSGSIDPDSELNKHGYISEAYELPEITSDNLGGYPNPNPRHIGAKRSRW